MSNKKGFALIETIITVTILATSLLYVYSSFNSLLIKEKRRVHYDDIAYIYRTHYIKDFLSYYDLNYTLDLLSEDNPLIIVGCDYDGLFYSDRSGQELCNQIIPNLNAVTILVGKKDQSYIEDCEDNNTSNKCLYLNNLSADFRTYLETLGVMDATEYVMIIEYSSVNNENIEEKNYSWIKI